MEENITITRLKDLPDTAQMIERSTDDIPVSFNNIKTLLNSNPHILDNQIIKRVINSVKVNQAQYEDSQKQANEE